MDLEEVRHFMSQLLEELSLIHDYLLHTDRLFYIFTVMFTFASLAAAWIYHQREEDRDLQLRLSVANKAEQSRNELSCSNHNDTHQQRRLQEISGKKRDVSVPVISRDQTDLSDYRQDVAIIDNSRSQRRTLRNEFGLQEQDRNWLVHEDSRSGSPTLLDNFTLQDYDVTFPANNQPYFRSLLCNDIIYESLETELLEENVNHVSDSGEFRFQPTDYGQEVEYGLHGSPTDTSDHRELQCTDWQLKDDGITLNEIPDKVSSNSTFVSDPKAVRTAGTCYDSDTETIFVDVEPILFAPVFERGRNGGKLAPRHRRSLSDPLHTRAWRFQDHSSNNLLKRSGSDSTINVSSVKSVDKYLCFHNRRHSTLSAYGSYLWFQTEASMSAQNAKDRQEFDILRICGLIEVCEPEIPQTNLPQEFENNEFIHRVTKLRESPERNERIKKYSNHKSWLDSKQVEEAQPTEEISELGLKPLELVSVEIEVDKSLRLSIGLEYQVQESDTNQNTLVEIVEESPISKVQVLDESSEMVFLCKIIDDSTCRGEEISFSELPKTCLHSSNLTGIADIVEIDDVCLSPIDIVDVDSAASGNEKHFVNDNFGVERNYESTLGWALSSEQEILQILWSDPEFEKDTRTKQGEEETCAVSCLSGTPPVHESQLCDIVGLLNLCPVVEVPVDKSLVPASTEMRKRRTLILVKENALSAFTASKECAIDDAAIKLMSELSLVDQTSMRQHAGEFDLEVNPWPQSRDSNSSRNQREAAVLTNFKRESQGSLYFKTMGVCDFQDLQGDVNEAERYLVAENNDRIECFCNDDSNSLIHKGEQGIKGDLFNSKGELNGKASQVYSIGNEEKVNNSNILKVYKYSSIGGTETDTLNSDDRYGQDLSISEKEERISDHLVKKQEVFYVQAEPEGEFYEAIELYGPFNFGCIDLHSNMGQLLCTTEPLPSSLVPSNFFDEVDVTIVHNNDFAIVDFTDKAVQQEPDAVFTDNMNPLRVQSNLVEHNGDPNKPSSLVADFHARELNQSNVEDNNEYFTVSKTKIIYDERDGHFLKTEVNEKNRHCVPADLLNRENCDTVLSSPKSQHRKQEYEDKLERIRIQDLTDGIQTSRQHGDQDELTSSTREKEIEENNLLLNTASESSSLNSSESSDSGNVGEYTIQTPPELKGITYSSDKDISLRRSRLSSRVVERLRELAERYRQQEIYGLDGKGFFSGSEYCIQTENDDVFDLTQEGYNDKNSGTVDTVDGGEIKTNSSSNNEEGALTSDKNENIYHEDRQDGVPVISDTDFVTEDKKLSSECTSLTDFPSLHEEQYLCELKLEESVEEVPVIVTQSHLVEGHLEQVVSAGEEEEEVYFIPREYHNDVEESVATKINADGDCKLKSDKGTHLRILPHYLLRDDEISSNEDWHSADDYLSSEEQTECNKINIVQNDQGIDEEELFVNVGVKKVNGDTEATLTKDNSEKDTEHFSQLTGDSGYLSAEVKDRIFTYDEVYADVQSVETEKVKLENFPWGTPEYITNHLQVDRNDPICEYEHSGVKKTEGFDRSTSAPGSSANSNLDSINSCNFKEWNSRIDEDKSRLDDKQAQLPSFGEQKGKLVHKTDLTIERLKPRGLQLDISFSVGGTRESTAGGELDSTPLEEKETTDSCKNDEFVEPGLLDVPSKLDSLQTVDCSEVGENIPSFENKDHSLPLEQDDNKRLSDVEDIEKTGLQHSILLSDSLPFRRCNSLPLNFETRGLEDMACFGHRTKDDQVLDDGYTPSTVRLRKSKSSEVLKRKKVLSLLCGITKDGKHKVLERTLSDEVGTQTEDSFLLSRFLEWPAIPAEAVNVRLVDENRETSCDNAKGHVEASPAAGRELINNQPVQDSTVLPNERSQRVVNEDNVESRKDISFVRTDTGLEKIEKRSTKGVHIRTENYPSIGTRCLDIERIGSEMDLAYLIKDTRGDYQESDVDDFPPPPLFLGSVDSVTDTMTSSQASLTPISSISSEDTVIRYSEDSSDETLANNEYAGLELNAFTIENNRHPEGEERLDDIRADYWHSVNVLGNSSTKGASVWHKTIKEDTVCEDTPIDKNVDVITLSKKKWFKGDRTSASEAMKVREEVAQTSRPEFKSKLNTESDLNVKASFIAKGKLQTKTEERRMQGKYSTGSNPTVALSHKEKVEKKNITPLATKPHNTNSISALNFWKNLENKNSQKESSIYEQNHIINRERRSVVMETKTKESGVFRTGVGSIYPNDFNDRTKVDKINNINQRKKDDISSTESKKITTAILSVGRNIPKGIGDKVSKIFKMEKVVKERKLSNSSTTEVEKNIEKQNNGTSTEEGKLGYNDAPIQVEQSDGTAVCLASERRSSPMEEVGKLAVKDEAGSVEFAPTMEVPISPVVEMENHSVLQEETVTEMPSEIPPVIETEVVIQESQPEAARMPPSNQVVKNEDAISPQPPTMKTVVKADTADFITDSDSDAQESISEEVVYQEEKLGSESLFYVMGSFRRKGRRPHALKRSYSVRERGLSYHTEYEEQRGARSAPGSPRLPRSDRSHHETEADTPKARSRTPIMYRRKTSTSTEHDIWPSPNNLENYGFTVAVVSSRSASVASNYSDMDGCSSVASSGFWGNWETSIDDFKEDLIDKGSRISKPSPFPYGVLETDLDAVLPSNVSGKHSDSEGSQKAAEKSMSSTRKLSTSSLISSSTLSLSGDDCPSSVDGQIQKSGKTVTVRNWPEFGDRRPRRTRRRSKPKPLAMVSATEAPPTGIRRPVPSGKVPSPVVGRKELVSQSHDVHPDRERMFLRTSSREKDSRTSESDISEHTATPGPDDMLPPRKHRGSSASQSTSSRSSGKGTETAYQSPGISSKSSDEPPSVAAQVKRTPVLQENITVVNSKDTFAEPEAHPENVLGKTERHHAPHGNWKPIRASSPIVKPNLSPSTISTSQISSSPDDDISKSKCAGRSENQRGRGAIRPTPRRLSSHSSPGNNSHSPSVSPALSKSPLETSFRPIPPASHQRSDSFRSTRSQGGSVTLDGTETDGVQSDEAGLFSDVSNFDSVSLFDESNSFADPSTGGMQFLGATSPLSKLSAYPTGEFRGKPKEIVCAYPLCDRVPKRTASSSYTSCIACFTYYCSRDCRRADWKEHKQKCYHGRVHFYVKALLRRLEEDPDLSFYLSQMAIDNCQERGRGSIMIHFSSPMSLKLFLIERTNVFPQAPVFSNRAELKRDPALKDQDDHLLQFVTNYQTKKEYVVSITVAVGDSRRQSVEKAEFRLNSSIVRRCITLPLHQEFISLESNGYSPSSYEIRTFTVPELKRHKFVNDVEARRHYCGEISRNLRRCGVYLRRDYPEEYQLFCLYVERNEMFEPMTLFGTAEGKTFKCLVYPPGSDRAESSMESRETGVLI